MLKGKKYSVPRSSPHTLPNRDGCYIRHFNESHYLPAVLNFRSPGKRGLRRNGWPRGGCVEKGDGKKMSGLELNAKQQLSPLIVPPERVLGERNRFSICSPV